MSCLDSESIHCRSSTRTTSGCSSPAAARTPSAPAHAASGLGDGPSASVSAISRAWRCARGMLPNSAWNGVSRSAAAANGSTASDSTPRTQQTRWDVARATWRSNAVLPIPGSPSTTPEVPPPVTEPTSAFSRRRSLDRPTKDSSAKSYRGHGRKSSDAADAVIALIPLRAEAAFRVTHEPALRHRFRLLSGAFPDASQIRRRQCFSGVRREGAAVPDGERLDGVDLRVGVPDVEVARVVAALGLATSEASERAIHLLENLSGAPDRLKSAVATAWLERAPRRRAVVVQSGESAGPGWVRTGLALLRPSAPASDRGGMGRDAAHPRRHAHCIPRR